MTTKEGILLHGEKATGAVIGECQLLLDLETLHAIDSVKE
jgi:hypothetical protein